MRPHLRVVGGDAVPDQAERRGQPVDQVDGDRDVVLPGQRVGGVDAGRAGADDGDPQRAVRGTGVVAVIGHVASFPARQEHQARCGRGRH